MSDWQPEYRPRQADGWPQGTPPQWQLGVPPRRDDPWGGQPGTWQQEAYPQPPQWQQPYQPPAPQYQPARHQPPPPRRRQGSGYGPWIAGGAVVLLAVGGGAFYVLHGRASSPAATASAATPDTTAAAKSAATSFLALYSAQQWGAAWQYLTPAEKTEAPQSVYEEVHQECPSNASSLAYQVTGVTMAGKTAVITYTIAGALSKLASATMAETWAPSGWTVQPNNFGIYKHGSVKADVAAAKAAGDCGKS